MTSYQYRAWKKSVEITQELYSLTDTELALVIFTQVGGKARQQLDVLEIEDLKSLDGLEMIWSLLDKSHEKMAHERLDDASEKWGKAHRENGQGMDEWVGYLKRTKLD